MLQKQGNLCKKSGNPTKNWPTKVFTYNISLKRFSLWLRFLVRSLLPMFPIVKMQWERNAGFCATVCVRVSVSVCVCVTTFAGFCISQINCSSKNSAQLCCGFYLLFRKKTTTKATFRCSSTAFQFWDTFRSSNESAQLRVRLPTDVTSAFGLRFRRYRFAFGFGFGLERSPSPRLPTQSDIHSQTVRFGSGSCWEKRKSRGGKAE